MKMKSESEVAQLCPTLRDSMGCSLPGSSAHGFSRQEYGSGVPVRGDGKYTTVCLRDVPLDGVGGSESLSSAWRVDISQVNI